MSQGVCVLPMPAMRSAAAGLRVPRLDGIDQRASRPDRQQLRPRLARALVDAGVPCDVQSGEDAEACIRLALAEWVARHGSVIVDRRYELSAGICTALDPYLEETDGRCFLTLDADSAHVVHIGPMIRWLDAVDPQLPATVYQALLSAQWVARIYSLPDAEEFFLMRTDGLDEEDLKHVEFPPRKVPKPLLRKPLGARAIGQRRRRWPADVRALIDVALELKELSAAFGRIRPRYAQHDMPSIIYDMGAPVPALVVSIEEHDFVHAAFDDESQYMLEIEPEPNLWWLLDEMSTEQVRRAFHGLGQAIEILAMTVRLMDLLPTTADRVTPRTRVRIGAGRPLAQVLAGTCVEAVA